MDSRAGRRSDDLATLHQWGEKYRQTAPKVSSESRQKVGVIVFLGGDWVVMRSFSGKIIGCRRLKH